MHNVAAKFKMNAFYAPWRLCCVVVCNGSFVLCLVCDGHKLHNNTIKLWSKNISSECEPLIGQIKLHIVAAQKHSHSQPSQQILYSPFDKVSGKKEEFRIVWNGKNGWKSVAINPSASRPDKQNYYSPVLLRHQQKLKSMGLPILGGVIKPSSTIKHADTHNKRGTKNFRVKMPSII